MGYFDERRFLVTGGAGFLGSYVVRKLEERGAREIFVPRSCDYDLVDRRAVQRAFDQARPQVVLHLAARVGGIGANRASPATFFYENLMMGAQVLDEAHRRGVEKLVLVGTICAYPKHTAVPFREEDLWNGYPEETNAPYGIAKKALLVQAQAYRAQYGFNAIYLLPVNLYGPGENFDLATSHVIPALIRKCLSATERGEDRIVCWGDGTPTREFLHAEDCAEGICLATERYNGEEPVNLGSGNEIAIKDLAELIARLTGFGGRIEWDKSQPNGQPRRRLDVTRAMEAFGFRAQKDLARGLEETIRWYRSQLAR